MKITRNDTIKKRDYPFLIRLTAKEKQKLSKYALEEDLSQAQVARKALKKLLDNKNKI